MLFPEAAGDQKKTQAGWNSASVTQASQASREQLSLVLGISAPLQLYIIKDQEIPRLSLFDYCLMLACVISSMLNFNYFLLHTPQILADIACSRSINMDFIHE